MSLFRTSCGRLCLALSCLSLLFVSIAQSTPLIQEQCVETDAHEARQVNHFWTFTDEDPLTLIFSPEVIAKQQNAPVEMIHAELRELTNPFNPPSLYRLQFADRADSESNPSTNAIFVDLYKIEKLGDPSGTIIFPAQVSDFMINPNPRGTIDEGVHFAFDVPHRSEASSNDSWIYDMVTPLSKGEERDDLRRFQSISGTLLYSESGNLSFGSIATHHQPRGEQTLSGNTSPEDISRHRAAVAHVPGQFVAHMTNPAGLIPPLFNSFSIEIDQPSLIQPYYAANFFNLEDRSADGPALVIHHSYNSGQPSAHFIGLRQGAPLRFERHSSLPSVGIERGDPAIHFFAHLDQNPLSELSDKIRSPEDETAELIAADEQWESLVDNTYQIEGTIHRQGQAMGHFLVDSQWIEKAQSITQIDIADLETVSIHQRTYAKLPWRSTNLVFVKEVERLNCIR